MEELVVDREFVNRITSIVQEILNQTFVSGGKTRIKDMRGRITFACPYCGDSYKDEHKKRGNLFWDTLQYHCYNGGCNKHASLNSMLKDFGLRNAVSSKERLAILEHIKTHSHRFDKVATLEYDLFEKLIKLSIPKDDFYKVTRSSPIKKGSFGYNILKERLLIHNIDEFAIGSNRLLILNLTPDKQRVIGYQIRLLNKTGDNKYLSFNIEKLRQQAGLKAPRFELNCSDQEADRLNKLSTIFHILNSDFTQPLTVFEGPIDAKFMRNSIGLATVGRDLGMFDDIPDVRYFLDNDKAGKDKMRELLREGKYVFLWKKFISDFNLLNHLPEDMKQKEIPIKDLNDIVKVCYYAKLKAHKYINQYFSNNSFDLLYI